jgi:hypothetical protein
MPRGSTRPLTRLPTLPVLVNPASICQYPYHLYGPCLPILEASANSTRPANTRQPPMPCHHLPALPALRALPTMPALPPSANPVSFIQPSTAPRPGYRPRHRALKSHGLAHTYILGFSTSNIAPWPWTCISKPYKECLEIIDTGLKTCIRSVHHMKVVPGRRESMLL